MSNDHEIPLPPAATSAFTRCCFTVANKMHQTRSWILNGSIYVPDKELHYRLVFSTTAVEYVNSLTADPQLGPMVTHYAKSLREEILQLHVFPRAKFDYGKLGYSDGYLDIEDRQLHPYQLLPPGVYPFAAFPDAFTTLGPPVLYQAMCNKHIAQDISNPPNAVDKFFSGLRQLFFKRQRKSPVLFLIGPADTAKSSMLEWIRLVWAPDMIATINEGNFPFSDFDTEAGGRRILMVEEMSTKKCSRSSMLTLLEGGRTTVEKKRGHARVINLDIPCVFNGNYKLEYRSPSGDLSYNDALHSRICYLWTHNIIPSHERNRAVVDAVNKEVGAIVKLLICDVNN